MTVHHSLKPLLLASACALSLVACGGSGSNNTDNRTPAPQPQPVSVDYQQMLDAFVSDEVSGVILHIDTPAEDFLGSAGLADRETNIAMRTDHQMPTGSAGKKATALLVAQLHQDGLLDIDATLDTWLDEALLSRIDNSRDMTLRQLLNHTAGVHNYLAEDTIDDWFTALLADPQSIKTDSFALQFSLDKPGYFTPGQGFQYSNTGYLLAGLILDKVLGEHHAGALRQRLLEPLGLNHTFYTGVEKDRGEVIAGYAKLDGQWLNTHPYYSNIGVADAPLSSTVEDMSRLLKAIVTDTEIVNDDIRELMLGDKSLVRQEANLDYGLGLFKETLKGRTIYHHAGTDPGYTAYNLYIADTDTTMTAFFNCGVTDECTVQIDAFIDQLLATLL